MFQFPPHEPCCSRVRPLASKPECPRPVAQSIHHLAKSNHAPRILAQILRASRQGSRFVRVGARGRILLAQDGHINDPTGLLLSQRALSQRALGALSISPVRVAVSEELNEA